MSENETTVAATLEEKAKIINESRTGKGTRVKVGATRGRNPQAISFEAFDESKPDTLPTTLSEFMELTKISDEDAIVDYLIDGFNASSYTLASDPVAEYVDASWPEDLQKAFRTVVRQYSANTGTSIEDSVSMIRPGFEAKALSLKTA